MKFRCFENPAVWAVPAGAADDAQGLSVHQSEDGPSIVTVGANVSDESLLQWLPNLERHGCTLAHLQQARQGQRVVVRTSDWKDGEA